ncbi:MAG TPA: FAD-dependent oxidoreductase [Longimicrobiaceae bacterium]|nr:FAD-dependent oxidoreductase [Longimicrobiaceae bacterium]
MPDPILDVAIVGAGVSGVYSGWRLRSAHPPRSVTVFEASDRVGGRLLSVEPPGIENMVAELGGMRILPAVQPRIANLLKVLNRGRGNRIETYPFPVDEPANIAYLRGVHLRLQDFTTHPDRVPYRLNFLERGHTAGQIILNAIEQIVPGITAPGLTEYQRRRMARDCRFGGKPLYQQGFWQVLMRVISGEAYMLGMDAGGYQSTLSNWNAADAIPWYLSDFGVEPKYEGFKRGFQQVPLTLAERFRKAGGTLELNRHMTGFEVSADSGTVALHFTEGGSVQARHLVLAVPRRSLDLLRPGSVFLQQREVRTLVESVTPRPLFKLFTTYEYPWWLPAGVEAGRTVTDLPVRQTYYWPTDQGQPAKSGPAMLMASYDDGLNIGFWDGFRPKRGIGWRENAERPLNLEYFKGRSETSGKEGEELDWHRYRAPRAMVAELQRQLALIHGLSFTPEVQEAAFHDWGDDPFGGGWNSWNIGVKSWDVIKRIVQPQPGVPVYVCGEAYSDAQGWVEGALQTADLMLRKFRVEPLLEEGLGD